MVQAGTAFVTNAPDEYREFDYHYRFNPLP
jgi:hypothetical protein